MRASEPVTGPSGRGQRRSCLLIHPASILSLVQCSNINEERLAFKGIRPFRRTNPLSSNLLWRDDVMFCTAKIKPQDNELAIFLATAYYPTVLRAVFRGTDHIVHLKTGLEWRVEERNGCRASFVPQKWSNPAVATVCLLESKPVAKEFVPV